MNSPNGNYFFFKIPLFDNIPNMILNGNISIKIYPYLNKCIVR